MRTKGVVQIAPDDLDRMRMAELKLTRVVHSAKLCLGIDGHVVSVATLKSSGLPGYDEKIRKQMSAWEYAPYQVDGKPAPVCTAVTIIYSQPLPAKAP